MFHFPRGKCHEMSKFLEDFPKWGVRNSDLFDSNDDYD